MTATTSILTRATASVLAGVATFTLFSTVHAKTDADFQAKVESGIEQEMRLPNTYKQGRSGTAIVALTVSADGQVQSATLVQSAGNAAFDREALRTANTVSYPSTGATRTVAMVLGFNQKVTEQAQRDAVALAENFSAKQKVMLANDMTAQQPDS
jgi:TonB family protein